MLSVSRVRYTECAVEYVPVPATTEARSPTVSTAAAKSCRRSSSLKVGDSPVVPATTSPSEPLSTRCAQRRLKASRLTVPSPLNGVTIAVRTWPSTGPILRSRRAEAPEVAGEPDSRERLLGLSRRLAAPVRVESIRVPRLRELPQLLRREEAAFRKAVLLPPAVDVLFRPEGEHRPSGERDVLPPTSRRHREVDHGVERLELAVLDAQLDLLPAVGARGIDHPVRADHCEDAESIPHTVPPPRTSVAGHDAEASRDGGERVRHPDVRRSGREDDDVALLETAISLLGLIRRNGQRLGRLGGGRRLSDGEEALVQVKANVPVEFLGHSRSASRPTVTPGGSVRSRSSTMRTPGTNASRESVS